MKRIDRMRLTKHALVWYFIGYNKAQHTKTAPGTLTPEEVANISLNALGRKPTIIPGFTNKLAYFIMNRIVPRTWAIALMNKNTKDLS
ncbi:hypothetical protein [Formosa maritima]|uniref:Uncharacterized protein n=1 Tax=Formosa maritima TaxID=2592046 RepID=A0A5D0GJ16_9FLAO|nr:hypothetical protein [Formosa maritima]TYA59015.1 hypothetical protein FVF61_02375 [Formosa maritima]